MTGDCKYITFHGGVEPVTVIMFPAFLEHQAVARSLKSMVGPPISAGFVCFTDGVPRAYGESLSLDLKSAPEVDSVLLRRLLS